MLDQGGVPRARSARSACGYSTMAAAASTFRLAESSEEDQFDSVLLEARAALIEKIEQDAPGGLAVNSFHLCCDPDCQSSIGDKRRKAADGPHVHCDLCQTVLAIGDPPLKSF